MMMMMTFSIYEYISTYGFQNNQTYIVLDLRVCFADDTELVALTISLIKCLFYAPKYQKKKTITLLFCGLLFTLRVFLCRYCCVGCLFVMLTALSKNDELRLMAKYQVNSIFFFCEF